MTAPRPLRVPRVGTQGFGGGRAGLCPSSVPQDRRALRVLWSRFPVPARGKVCRRRRLAPLAGFEPAALTGYCFPWLYQLSYSGVCPPVQGRRTRPSAAPAGREGERERRSAEVASPPRFYPSMTIKGRAHYSGHLKIFYSRPHSSSMVTLKKSARHSKLSALGALFPRSYWAIMFLDSPHSSESTRRLIRLRSRSLRRF